MHAALQFACPGAKVLQEVEQPSLPTVQPLARLGALVIVPVVVGSVVVAGLVALVEGHLLVWKQSESQSSHAALQNGCPGAKVLQDVEQPSVPVVQPFAASVMEADGVLRPSVVASGRSLFSVRWCFRTPTASPAVCCGVARACTAKIVSIENKVLQCMFRTKTLLNTRKLEDWS